MRRFGLIGYPLTHSFSRKYFTEKFEREGPGDCVYDNFPLTSITEFPGLFEQHNDLVGLNVTIPYKEQVLAYLHELDEVVKQTRACNCITVKAGRLKGYNTDVIGFEESLKPLLQPFHRKALVLGTGGASKAVEYVLRKNKIDYKLVSRTPREGNQLSYEQVSPAVIAENLLLINTTPLGMYPKDNDAPAIPYEAITGRHYLFDLVYNPAKTLFLAKGEAQGAAIKNGMDMLSLQAEANWVIWNKA